MKNGTVKTSAVTRRIFNFAAEGNVLEILSMIPIASHVNGIESFWSYAKSRLHQFHGIKPEKFYLHLKECEYRFNHRRDNLYAELLKLLRKYPL